MQNEAVPTPKFQRYEKVFSSEERVAVERAGRQGVVVWSEYTRFSVYDQGLKKPRRWSEWVYSVHLPDRDCYSSFRESQLQSAGCLDSEKNYFSNRFEVSFDTVPVDDTPVLEGCYRLPGRFWEVFAFVKEDLEELQHDLVTWPSGITGVQFDVPESAVLDRDYVIRAMTSAFVADSCTVVYGPDSLLLK